MGLSNVTERYFVTGTDTEVGKTVASAALLQAARELFDQYAKDAGVRDVPAAMAQALGGSTGGEATPGESVMPADVWARLAAAVQTEAARSRHDKALNPDSVLLRPDPLLAPKKSARREDAEPFDLASPGRLLFAAGLVVLAGVVVTAYILTRPATTATSPSPGRGHADSAPASQAAVDGGGGDR